MKPINYGNCYAASPYGQKVIKRPALHTSKVVIGKTYISYKIK